MLSVTHRVHTLLNDFRRLYFPQYKQYIYSQCKRATFVEIFVLTSIVVDVNPTSNTSYIQTAIAFVTLDLIDQRQFVI